MSSYHSAGLSVSSGQWGMADNKYLKSVLSFGGENVLLGIMGPQSCGFTKKE